MKFWQNNQCWQFNLSDIDYFGKQISPRLFQIPWSGPKSCVGHSGPFWTFNIRKTVLKSSLKSPGRALSKNVTFELLRQIRSWNFLVKTCDIISYRPWNLKKTWWNIFKISIFQLLSITVRSGRIWRFQGAFMGLKTSVETCFTVDLPQKTPFSASKS